MSSEKIFCDKIKQLLPHLPKTCWFPIPESEKDQEKREFSWIATKFGGSNFWLPEDLEEGSHTCKECDQLKTFFCQINMAQLPKEYQERCGLHSGLFQLFYCQECCPNVNFDPPEDFKLEILNPSQVSISSLKYLSAAKVEPKQVATLPSLLQTYCNDVQAREDKRIQLGTLKEFVITKWQESIYKDIPQEQEFSETESNIRALEMTDDEIEKQFENLSDIAWEKHDDSWISSNRRSSRNRLPYSTPQGGVKLGGYVDFIQGVEYPDCEKCNQTMDLTFLQLEQVDILDFMWGDAGVGHITLCPLCKTPALAWACG